MLCPKDSRAIYAPGLIKAHLISLGTLDCLCGERHIAYSRKQLLCGCNSEFWPEELPVEAVKHSMLLFKPLPITTHTPSNYLDTKPEESRGSTARDHGMPTALCRPLCGRQSSAEHHVQTDRPQTSSDVIRLNCPHFCGLGAWGTIASNER
ncbi:hypothetical protein BaRGS_00000210 [Batillaria attramentaria]|uniref:Uncharacterized protein n=1 Tax=Batillaria attramentaria TaxID=370345 RepID=A0ABD0MBU1_9CAEN